MQTDPLGYAGKRVVVTGSRSGIGVATVRLLLDAGPHAHGIDQRQPNHPLPACTQTNLRQRSDSKRAVAKKR